MTKPNIIRKNCSLIKVFVLPGLWVVHLFTITDRRHYGGGEVSIQTGNADRMCIDTAIKIVHSTDKCPFKINCSVLANARLTGYSFNLQSKNCEKRNLYIW